MSVWGFGWTSGFTGISSSKAEVYSILQPCQAQTFTKLSSLMGCPQTAVKSVSFIMSLCFVYPNWLSKKSLLYVGMYLSGEWQKKNIRLGLTHTHTPGRGGCCTFGVDSSAILIFNWWWELTIEPRKGEQRKKGLKGSRIVDYIIQHQLTVTPFAIARFKASISRGLLTLCRIVINCWIIYCFFLQVDYNWWTI